MSVFEMHLQLCLVNILNTFRAWRKGLVVDLLGMLHTLLRHPVCISILPWTDLDLTLDTSQTYLNVTMHLSCIVNTYYVKYSYTYIVSTDTYIHTHAWYLACTCFTVTQKVPRSSTAIFYFTDIKIAIAFYFMNFWSTEIRC